MSVRLKEGVMVDIGISAGWGEKESVEKGGRYTSDMNRAELMAYFAEVRQAASVIDRRYFRGRRGGSLRGGESIIVELEE